MSDDIRTTYKGPTDTLGSRITARYRGRQLTVPYDYAASDPHAVAAEAVAGAPVERVGELTRGYRYRVTPG